MGITAEGCASGKAAMPETLPPRFLSLAAAETYSSLSAETLRRLIRRGLLKAYKPSAGRVVIDRLQLDELILGSARPA
jgi:hypothetical protein